MSHRLDPNGLVQIVKIHLTVPIIRFVPGVVQTLIWVNG